MPDQLDIVQQIATDKFEAFAAEVQLKHDPHGGWQSLNQLPRLTDKERALILRAYPDIAYDIVLAASDLADAIERGPAELAEHVALIVKLQLERALRQALFDHLQWLDREKSGANEIHTSMYLSVMPSCQRAREAKEGLWI